MFGVRIVAFAAALLGMAAAMPLDPAEAKPGDGSEGASAKSRVSHVKAHWRKQRATAHARKSYAKHRARTSYGQNAAKRKSYARSATKRWSYAQSAAKPTTSASRLSPAASAVRNASAPIRVTASAKASAGIGPRPARWCGWWMRTQLGGGPEYNLARNWKNWGRPSGPRVGAVVVWPHHVGIITGRAANGQWIVKSGNDGGRVRERPRSVAGAVFRVGGGRAA